MEVDLSKVLEYSMDCLDNRAQLRSIMMDMYPDKTRDINIILTVYDSGIPKEIKNNGIVDMSTQYNWFMQRIEEECGLQKLYAMEGINAWIEGFKKIGIVTVTSRNTFQSEVKHDFLRSSETGFEKRVKQILIVMFIGVVCIAFIILITIIIPNGKYNSAVELYNEGKYEDAYKAFGYLDYKDSVDKMAECFFLKQGTTKVTVGSTIKFGFYEQDNNTSNGEEEIAWNVLAVEENKALIISQYALDCKEYNREYIETTWEKCSIRNWLNEEFFNEAFDSNLQKMIVSSIVTADRNPSYSTSLGNNTIDKVFLLSITELNKYFNSKENRKCMPTRYAKEQGAFTVGWDSEGDETVRWWLRTPGKDAYLAAYVNRGGNVDVKGYSVDDIRYSVRPAMWINLGS